MALVVSPEIILEYRTIAEDRDVRRLVVRKGVEVARYRELLQELLGFFVVVNPEGEAPACRDEDDRKFLHAAVAANVDYLITYDNDLLDIKQIGACAILTPPDALERLRMDGVEI